MIRVLLALVLVDASLAHNWINMPARGPKVSTLKPCPPRQFLQQKHAQANPGDLVPVEWASGHTNSFGSFVLISAADEEKLLGYSQKVFEEYIKGAPSSKNFKQYHVARDVDSMTSYLKHKTEWDSSTTVFSKTVDRKTAHNRPAGFRELRTGAEPGFLEYNPAITEERRSLRWASYANSKYPWIKAASGYNVVAHYPSDGSISQFQIPSDLPSGKYILHWWWRGYFNCVDMDVVPKDKKVTDMWGTADSNNKIMIKIDHCASWNHQERQANKGSFNLQQKAELLAAAQKAKPLFAPAKEAKTKADAAVAKATRDKDTAKTAHTKAVAAQKVLQAKREEATKAVKAAGAIRPRDKAAVAAAKKVESSAKKENDTARKASTTAQAAYKKANQAYTKAKRAQRPASNAYNKAYANYYGKLNSYDWGVSYHFCTEVPAGTNEFATCKEICLKGKDGLKNFQCDSVNVVPWKIPSSSSFAGQINPMVPKQCRNMDVQDDSRICYAMREGKATDAGSAFTISNDPDDLVFYSTCLKLQPSADIQFAGNTCGAPCQLKEQTKHPVWRYGDRCIDCALMTKNANDSPTFLPEWKVAGTCKKCN